MVDYDENMTDEEARKMIEDKSYGGVMRTIASILNKLVEIDAVYGSDKIGAIAELKRNDETVELN